MESRAVERARIILASLEGKEMQQVARELQVSVLTVSKWRRRFSLFGVRGLRDQSRSGKPVRYDTAFRNKVLAALEVFDYRVFYWTNVGKTCSVG
jgi:transposase